jgi:methyl-accepting chemotaxis protein
MFKQLFSRTPGDQQHVAVRGAKANDSDLNLQGMVDALNRVQAVIRFDLDGVIIDANENFLKTMGYTLDEIKGRHHRMFVEPAYAAGNQYTEFWNRLRRGEFEQGEFKRIAKGGKEVWLQASYNPLYDDNNKLSGVAKFATDITAAKLRNAEFQGKTDAIERMQGVIEFDLDGKITRANQVFLDLMGYSLGEVVGRHHSMFVEPGVESTAEYREFWEGLRAGRADARVYKRFGKNGKVVWIQASYNPIFDLNGRPLKVVKFASDLTDIITQTETTQHTAHSVAAATEELSCSVAEISRNMDSSRKVTEGILETSLESGEQASQLIESTRSMEKIVGLIRNIAGRVNLLALNATIEAARAGAAGKGFAVVANEVKSLSDQTAKATNQIDQEIGSVQQISKKVAESIEKTLAGVTQVSKDVLSVATAMEQQAAATREISSHSASLVSAVGLLLDRAQHR